MREILGYERPCGFPGIRNVLVSIHTVECSSFVSQRIAEMDPRIHALGFPGCYRNEYAARLMTALATHPNVGAVLLVSLGCEGTDSGRMAEAIRAAGRPVEVVRIQEAGGTLAAIQQGRAVVGRMLGEMDRTPRVPMAVGGVAIEPVDFVLGDRDGGLIIPRRVAEEVITKAEEVVHTENLVRKAILEDVLPLDAYNRHGRF